MSLDVGSYNPETRTFTAIAATTTPVPRFYGTEILSFAKGAVRLGRFQSGRAPLLADHRNAVDAIVGLIESARLENDKLIVSGRLFDRDDDLINRIHDGLVAGVIRNVSVSYIPHMAHDARDADGRLVVTQTDWEPTELSIVAVPLDPNAHIRTLETTMPTANNPVPTENQPSNITTPAADLHEAYRLAASRSFPIHQVASHFDGGGTLDQFRAVVLDRVAAAHSHLRISPHHGNGNSGGDTLDNPEFLSIAIKEAIYARMSGTAPKGAAVELVGRSLLDMGAMFLEARGERVSWRSRAVLAERVMTRMHTRDDFPTLLLGAGDRVMQAAFQAAASPLKALARQRNARDFRPMTTVKLSEAPALKKTLEGGEITYGTRGESKETFALATYARIFGISVQAIINDDLGAFANFAGDFSRAAADVESDLLAGLLTVNSGNGIDMSDGSPLYTTARGNKAASGDPISEASLSAARLAMRKMTGLDGKTPIGVVPKHLVVGPEKETEADKMLAVLASTETQNVNPFSSKLALLVDPRLPGNAWRIFSDIPTIIMSYLEGQEGPQTSIREGWDILGTEFRCVLHFGCGIEEWRGTYLNSGS
jgi:hypothetical protein